VLKEDEKECDTGGINIPPNAFSLKIWFEVLRLGIWVDMKKWDRKTNQWKIPTIPHIYYYPAPVNRTFVAEGTLGNERIVMVLDNHDPVDD